MWPCRTDARIADIGYFSATLFWCALIVTQAEAFAVKESEETLCTSMQQTIEVMQGKVEKSNKTIFVISFENPAQFSSPSGSAGASAI